MSDKDENQATDESGSPLVGDLIGLGKVANSKLVQNIYADLRKAGATEQGAELVADVVKGLRLFTAPIQLLALGQDLLQKRLERVRSKVPEERQIEAHPQLAGPILENLRYMVDGDILTEMYLNLLARAIDRDRVGEANPAFVKIIEQLCPDEALLLLKLRGMEENNPPYSLPYSVYGPKRLELRGITIGEPKHYNMYITHLLALNLIRTTSYMHFSLFDLDRLPMTENMGMILSELDRRIETIRELFEKNENPQEVEATEFGSLFIQACIPEDFDIADWEKVVSSTADSSPK